MPEKVSVRLWTEDDIEYVFQSITSEDWGHTRRDIERCWRLEPNGCFIAELESDPVGHVSTINYGKLAWLGLFVVNPEKRGRGIGATLMRRAIDYLEQAGAETIRLEAEEAAVTLYRRLGFKEEFDSLRFSGHTNRHHKEPVRKGIEHMQDEDIERLVDLDSKYFGSQRFRVLKRLFDDDQRYCFIAKEGRETIGYLMCRQTRNAFWIGPWICEDPSRSGELLEACLSAIKDEETQLRFGFPSRNESMPTLLKKKGFVSTGKSIRMFRGEKKHQGIPQGVYGIGGPEKG